MPSRRDFIKTSSAFALGSLVVPHLPAKATQNAGVQLYSVRKEMLEDAAGTLKQLARIGFRQLESARSVKGNYYGLQPKEIRKIAEDLGMKVRSGHVGIDKDWQQSVDQAAEAGQEYLICSSLPSQGQTVDNYRKCADIFNKAAEDCRKQKIFFGYHNHATEFEKENGRVLYDVLLEQTDPALVKMEMDIGWLVVTGNDPFAYFKKYPDRFPLWHLKDMDLQKKQSTEFGKGGLDVKKLVENAKRSGMKYFFVEQEEYAVSAFESLTADYRYLDKLSV